MIWFSSDSHYYHFNVIRYCDRPFKTVEEMNEILIKNWNELVHPDDTVYFLGDFSLAIRPVELYTSRLNGIKILIAGNHDWCHPSNKKGRGEKLPKMIAKYKEHGWYDVQQSIQGLRLEDEIFNLCHFPYKGDYTDERFTNYRLEDDGRILLCGHIHEKWQSKFTSKGTLMVNVGVDVWDMKPVSLEQIRELVKNAQK